MFVGLRERWAVLGLSSVLGWCATTSSAQTNDPATMKRSVAQIIVHRPGLANETGAGFLVGADQGYLYFLTANHVVQNNSRIDLQFLGLATACMGQELSRVSEDLDAAVVRVARSCAASIDFPFWVTGNTSRLHQGMSSSAIGHPGSLEWSIAHTSVARATDPDDGRKFLLTKVGSIEKGNSGGPVLDGQGSLIGMVREVTSDFVYVEKIEPILSALQDDSWRVPVNNLRSPLPDFNGSWSDGTAGHVVKIRTNGDTVLLTRYNGQEEVDAPQGTVTGRHLHATFKMYGVNDGGEIDLTLSQDGQRLTGTTGAPRMGYGSQNYTLTRLETDQLPLRGAPTPQILTGLWNDGHADYYFEFSFNGYETHVTEYRSGMQFITTASVSVVGRRVRYSLPMSSGRLDVDLTVTSDNMIMEGTVTDRNTGQSRPYRLDKSTVGVR